MERYMWQDILRIGMPATILYLAVYMVRYPVFLVPFEDDIGPMTEKKWMSFAKIIGLCLGKLPAYMYVSSMPTRYRPLLLAVIFVVVTTMVTVVLPFLPPIGQVLALFSSSIADSISYGLVLGFLEGRRTSDVLTAMLNLVIVFGSSLARTIGAMYAESVDVRFMPMAIAATVTPPFLASLYFLSKAPPPSQADISARSLRKPMDAAQRRTFIRAYWPGLAAMIIGYMILNAYRFFRDLYVLEVYTEAFGRKPTASEYLIADWPGGAIAILFLFYVSRIQNNRSAVLFMVMMMLGGAAGVLLATIIYQAGHMSPQLWTSTVGAGMFIALMPFSGSIYDRLIAATHTEGTALFLVFASDGLAYVGSFLYLSGFASSAASYLTFYLWSAYGLAIAITVGSMFSLAYFRKTIPKHVYKPVKEDEADTLEMEELSEKIF